MFDMPIQIVRGHRTHCGPDFHWHNPPNQDDCFNLWYIVEGEGTLQTAEARYELHPGDCFLLRLWDVNTGKGRPGKPLVVSWVCFNCLDSKGRFLPPKKCPAPREHRRIPDISFFDRLIQRIISSHVEGPSYAAAAVQWLRVALLEVAHHDRRSRLTGLDLERDIMVETLCATIREFPEQVAGMRALAAQAKCSADHLIRIFKRHKGITPWEFVIRCRIEKAGSLLRFSSHSVGQVADLLGYPDIYSFSKQFKAHTGQTPTQYRK
jgi:AraC family transcriptional regulator of arabinose operon